MPKVRTPYGLALPPSDGLARLVCGSIEGIVLRVRLTSGDSMDVTYKDRDARTGGAGRTDPFEPMAMAPTPGMDPRNR